MEHPQNPMPSFNQDWLNKKSTIWLGILLCVLIKSSSAFFYYRGFTSILINLLFFLCVTFTLYLILNRNLFKWNLNPQLTLIYFLVPGISYHFLKLFLFRRGNIFLVQLLFLAGVLILTVFYLREGAQNRRPLNILMVPASIVIIMSIFGINLISFRNDTISVILISILILFGLYLTLAIIVTLLFTGSFGVTIRYWEWLLTEPPKKVIRALFNIDRDKVNCKHCERIIPLVGTYSCPGCKFTFKGHYFDWCPYCFSRFGYINCECGLSRKRPLLY